MPVAIFDYLVEKENPRESIDEYKEAVAERICGRCLKGYSFYKIRRLCE